MNKRNLILEQVNIVYAKIRGLFVVIPYTGTKSSYMNVTQQHKKKQDYEIMCRSNTVDERHFSHKHNITESCIKIY